MLKAEKGIALPFLTVFLVGLIGFAGVAIYTGLQAYFHGELQKAATSAAMAGAAAYYSQADPATGQPIANPAQAQAYAQSALSAIIDNSGGLKGFGVTLEGISTHDPTDSVTVALSGNLPTPFLAMVGMSSIKMSATGTAAAVRYVPTNFTGPVTINAPATLARRMVLQYPVIDGPGTEMYVEQNANERRGYTVLGCNSTECYSLMGGIKPAAGSRVIAGAGGAEVMYGSGFIDLNAAGVRKISNIRFVDDGVFNTLDTTGRIRIDTVPIPTTVRRVMLFGYAAACPRQGFCLPPYGFERVE